MAEPRYGLDGGGIHELTTNSAKYAWSDRQTGHMTIRIDYVDGLVIFEFRDDGRGYPEEMLRLEGHSVGWDLIQTITRDGLRGEVTIRNDEGVSTTIRFPAPF